MAVSSPIYPLARDMRDRVRFDRRAVTTTPLGGTKGEWYTLIPSRAAKLTAFRPRRKGGVEVEATRAQAVTPFDMYVRADSLTTTVTTDDRVVDTRNPARVFRINFIADLEGRGLWLTFQLDLGTATDG